MEWPLDAVLQANWTGEPAGRLYFTDIILSGVAMNRDSFTKLQVHQMFSRTMYG